jgi:hypothetical protein
LSYAAAAYHHGGIYTQRLVDEAEDLGYLDPPHGIHLHIDVRCSFQEMGETQHARDAWHFDEAFLGWIWVEGPGRTEMRKPNGAVRTVPAATWIPYHRVEHRAPPQERRGWRYFMRILWCDSPGMHALQLTPTAPIEYLR